MLLGEQGGRHQQRHLSSRLHGDEGGAQRDLGLPEADVAADHAIHRLARGQVLEHGVDRALLVGRFLEREARGELGVQPLVERKG